MFGSVSLTCAELKYYIMLKIWGSIAPKPKYSNNLWRVCYPRFFLTKTKYTPYIHPSNFQLSSIICEFSTNTEISKLPLRELWASYIRHSQQYLSVIFLWFCNQMTFDKHWKDSLTNGLNGFNKLYKLVS